MNRLFALPETILTQIYTMDPTYRDKLRYEIRNEIIKLSWTTFKREFLSNPIFDNKKLVVKKLELLLEYLQHTWSSFEFNPSSDIIISTSWKLMTYDNYHIDCNDDYDYDYDVDYDEPLLFSVSLRGKRVSEINGIIYMNGQYQHQMCMESDPDDIEIDVYNNREFKIVQCLR